MNYVVGVFKYIFLVPVLGMNIGFLTQGREKIYSLVCGFNILSAVFLGFFDLYLNWSNRFHPLDFCHRRENSWFSYMLVCGFVVSQFLLGNSISSVIVIFNVILNLLQMSWYIEYTLLQKTIVFYSFMDVYCTLLLFSWGSDHAHIRI